MCKKIGIGAVVVAAGLLVLNSSGLGSYVGTAFGKLRSCCKAQVPLEFEVERLRYQVNQLVPDMKKHLKGIVEEEVAIENLREEITITKGNLQNQKTKILAATRELENGATTISYDGRDLRAARVREKLDRDFRSYQRCEAELKSREKLLEARERSLEAARDQLESIKSQKEELEIQVAQLEAELKTVRLSQTRNKFQIDDSSLAQCKATLADIRTRLKVEKRLGELEGHFANTPMAEEVPVKSTKDLTKEVKAYFTDPKDDGKVVEKN
jgi:peptidoglycan hydrolase CwlO-like protein